MQKELQTAIIALMDDSGTLTPARVVEAARDEDHPLHSQFEWDDQKAAARYRLNTARQLIREVIYEVRRNNVKIESVAYIRDPSASPVEQGYRFVGSIEAQGDIAHDALVTELAGVESRIKRCRKLAQVFGLEALVEEALEDLVQFRIRMEREIEARRAAA